MIYIDELIILNFIIDYILLTTTSKILKINTTKTKIIFSTLIGELSILILFIKTNNIIISLIKLLLGLIMIKVAFNQKDKKEYIKTTIYFYIFSFFLGGTLYYFKIEDLVKYNYILLLIPIIMNIYEYFAYDLKDILRTRYKVNIYLNNGKILYLNGYMDTGNNLIDPYSNKKVIIINEEVEENFFLIPYQTVDSSSLMKCFIPKKIYIDKIGERKDIIVGISKNKFKGFNCLLNNKLMEE
ncbi:MAG: sigma-E processing peptidase SpoIIGA [Bacilli bacterium]|nr:sigma-E processing peptidase SpoIIGA [Bacilli bacterium]